ncbi:MAG TPA: hypothetical protein DCW83_14620, partial [Saprospirales bacterium]|nr:hypothetical protein [Saprospirales bacterium]
WHTGNDGANSGLHADLLDGQHGSYYAPVAGSTSFRPVTAGLYGTGHGSSMLPIWQYNSGHHGYGFGYVEGSSDSFRFDVSNNLVSGTPDFEISENVARVNGNTVWHAGNDGPSSGLDADTLDTVQASQFLRSDQADSGAGKITLTATEGLEVGGIRGRAFGDQGGDFIQLYERVHIGYPSGWGASAASAPSYGLSTHGGAQFNKGNVSGAPFTFNSNAIWHAGNDGPSSGLDADTVDGKHKDYLMHYKGIVSGNWDSIFSQTDGHMGVYEVQSINNSDSNYPTGSYTFGGVMSWQLDNSTFKLYAPHTGILWYQTGWNNDEYSGWRRLWDNLSDGANSGLDADLLDGQQGSYYYSAANPPPTYSKYVRSDANDTKSGNLVLQTSGAVTNSTTGLLFEVGGSYTDGRYRTRFRKQDVGGGIPLYIDQSGSTANSYTAQARFGTYSGNNYEFEVYGDINATGNIYDGGNAVWHAGNDGSGSGLDADLLDGYHKASLNPAHSHYRWTGIAASSTQARRFVIMRLYACPAHWDSNWQDIHLKVWSESYEATNLKYEICGDYNGGNQNTMFQLRLKDAGGSSEHGRFRLVLGTPVDAGWDHSGQNTYYVDVYAEVAHYMNFTVAADFYSAGFNLNTLPTSGGAVSVVYSSPAVSNITTFNEAKEHSYFANHKIWNDGNDGSGSGLDADLLDGVHASSLLRSDVSDSITAGTTYTFGTSNTEGLRFTNSSYDKSLYIGGWSSTNSSGISRIRNSNDNLHLDSGSAGHIYLNHYCTGNVHIRGSVAWHAGNDGPSSGLDADTLDTVQASQFLRSDTTDTATQINSPIFSGNISTSGDGQNNYPFRLTSDYNSYMTAVAGNTWGLFWAGNSGARYGTNGLGGPGNIWNNSGNPNEFTFVGGDSTAWTVQGSSGDSWQKGTARTADQGILWGDSNDGPNSGLDADTLDGNQASAFLGVSSKAADSEKLDGLDSTDFREYKWRSFSVAGDLDKFYPVLFSVGNGYHASSDLEISQSNVHQNGSGHGAFYARFGLNITGWGHIPQMMTLREYSKTGNTYISKIGDTDHATGQIGIWLRGSTTYYYRCSDGGILDSIRCENNQPFKSYDNSNDAYDITITHVTSVVDPIFNTSAHSGKVLNTGNIADYALRSTPDSTFSGTYLSMTGDFKYTPNLDFYNTSDISKRVSFDSGGGIYSTGNITAYSDIRVKENIEVIPNALEKVEQIRGVTFTRNDNTGDSKDKRYAGVIAQEIEKVLPEVVETNEEGTKSVAYGNMVGLLIEAVKELKQEVEDLKTQLKER